MSPDYVLSLIDDVGYDEAVARLRCLPPGKQWDLVVLCQQIWDGAVEDPGYVSPNALALVNFVEAALLRE